jgi:CBS domain-containing protein
MRVADIMTEPVITIDQGTTVQEAIRLIADEHVSALPVVDGAGTMLGVLSTTDILQAAAETTESGSRNVLLDQTTVAEVMSRHPLTIAPTADLREAARHLLYGGIHRLVVVERGRPVGVLSQTDLVGALATGRV